MGSGGDKSHAVIPMGSTHTFAHLASVHDSRALDSPRAFSIHHACCAPGGFRFTRCRGDGLSHWLASKPWLGMCLPAVLQDKDESLADSRRCP